MVSSGDGSSNLEGVFRCCGVSPPELGVLGVKRLAGSEFMCPGPLLFGGVVCVLGNDICV